MKWLKIGDQVVNMRTCKSINRSKEYGTDFEGIIFVFDDNYNYSFETANFEIVLSWVEEILDSRVENIINIQGIIDEIENGSR